jgi:hypothetical protein
MLELQIYRFNFLKDVRPCSRISMMMGVTLLLKTAAA